MLLILSTLANYRYVHYYTRTCYQRIVWVRSRRHLRCCWGVPLLSPSPSSSCWLVQNDDGDDDNVELSSYRQRPIQYGHPRCHVIGLLLYGPRRRRRRRDHHPPLSSSSPSPPSSSCWLLQDDDGDDDDLSSSHMTATSHRDGPMSCCGCEETHFAFLF